MRNAAMLPALALATLSLVWGYNWVAAKIALGYAGPVTFAALRFAIAPLCLLPMMVGMRVRVLPSRKHAIVAFLLGVLLAANFTATFIALQIGGAGKTAVLVYTMPFWVLIFARVALHERLTALQTLAAPFALIGLLVLIAPWSAGAQILPSVLAVSAGMTWGASVVYIKHLQGKEPVSMLVLTFWQMVVAAVTLTLGLSTLVTETPVIWSTAFIAALLFTAVIATGFGWVLFYYALRRMSAGVASLGTLATPVIGVLFAWLQLGERPAPLEAIGMLLIAVGLSLLAWDGMRTARVRKGRARSS
jgi:drug/metabolite transporter (DMT)-like permease